jgi:hypothetical protein
MNFTRIVSFALFTNGSFLAANIHSRLSQMGYQEAVKSGRFRVI